MQFYTRKVAGRPRPVEFVFFISVQKVVLGSLFLDRQPDCQRHRGHTHAVFAVGWIETGLIEVKRWTIAQPVQRCDWSLVQPENHEPQPAPLCSVVYELSMESDNRFRLERFGSSSSAPSPAMQIDHNVQCGLSVGRPTHAVHARLEAVVKILKATAETPAEAGSDGCHVGIPRLAAKVDVRANMDFFLLHRPGPHRHFLGESRRKAGATAKMIQLQQQALASQVFGKQRRHLAVTSADRFFIYGFSVFCKEVFSS